MKKIIGRMLLVMMVGFIIGGGLAEAKAQYDRYQRHKHDVELGMRLKAFCDLYGMEYTETKEAK